MAELPSAEQAFGKAPLPTAEEAFGPDPSKDHGVFSGLASDAYFALKTPGRIMDAFSQGASQQWGASLDEIDPGTAAYRAGGPQLPKEYHEGRSTALKAMNES